MGRSRRARRAPDDDGGANGGGDAGTGADAGPTGVEFSATRVAPPLPRLRRDGRPGPRPGRGGGADRHDAGEAGRHGARRLPAGGSRRRDGGPGSGGREGRAPRRCDGRRRRRALRGSGAGRDPAVDLHAGASWRRPRRGPHSRRGRLPPAARACACSPPTPAPAPRPRLRPRPLPQRHDGHHSSSASVRKPGRPSSAGPRSGRSRRVRRRLPRHRGAARRDADRQRPPVLLRARRAARQRRLLPRRHPRPAPLSPRARAQRHSPRAHRPRRLLPGRLPGALRALRGRHPRRRDVMPAGHAPARGGQRPPLRRGRARRGAAPRRPADRARRGPLQLHRGARAALRAGHARRLLGLPEPRRCTGCRRRIGISAFWFGSFDEIDNRDSRTTYGRAGDGTATPTEPFYPVFKTEFHRLDLRYDHDTPRGHLRVARRSASRTRSRARARRSDGVAATQPAAARRKGRSG